MTDNNIDQEKKIQAPQTQEQINNIHAQAINQMLNRMAIVEIASSKANANTDILNKRLDLFDKQIEFIEKRLDDAQE